MLVDRIGIRHPPAWCAAAGPAPEETAVDRTKADEDSTARSHGNDLSPSFRKRDLLPDSHFMYFS